MEEEIVVGALKLIVEIASGNEIIQLVEKQEVEDYKPLKEQKDAIKATVKEQKVASLEWETVEAKLLKETKVTIKDAD